jgi:GntR family transcriptional regulator
VALPRYEQVRDKLLEEFGHGQDLRLPSERELADHFSVSRMTVRQAIAALAAEGHVRAMHGIGTYISREPIAKTHALTSFTQDMIARGLTPASRVLSARAEEVGEHGDDELGLAPGDEVYVIERLRTGDGDPMCIERVRMPAKLVPGLLSENLENSLYETLSIHYRIRIVSATQQLRAVLLRTDEAELLGAPRRSPALLATRVGRDARGRAIEVASTTYRGDRFTFATTLKRD